MEQGDDDDVKSGRLASPKCCGPIFFKTNFVMSKKGFRTEVSLHFLAQAVKESCVLFFKTYMSVFEKAIQSTVYVKFLLYVNRNDNSNSYQLSPTY